MKDRLISQQGISLIEVIASVVILTILLTSFLSLFIASAKNSKFAENTLDYTLVTQSEMENIYGQLQGKKADEFKEVMEEIDYTEKGDKLFEREVSSDSDSTYIFQVELLPYQSTSENFSDLPDKLNHVKVSTWNTTKTKMHSVMESLIEWED